MNESNMLFNQVFTFYGGFAQLSANAKDQAGEALVLKQFQQQITELKQIIAAKDEIIEAKDLVIEAAINNGDGDNARILALTQELQLQKALMEGEAKRHLEVKRKLYDDFQVDIKKASRKFKVFKGLAQLEFRVKDAIIKKMTVDQESMKFEVKSLKTVIEVPRLRNEMKNFDFDKLSF